MPQSETQRKAAPAPKEIGAAEAYRVCDPASLGFETTADLPPLDQVIGQERAVRAVDFGIGIRSEGYNIYALGPTGTGKASTILQFLEREAAGLPVPDDWVYVNNFSVPHQPNAIRLPAGKGCEFRGDMEKLIEDLQAAITQAFEGEEYESQRREIAQQVSERQEKQLDALRGQAESRGFTMVRTPAGLAFAPKTEEGETMSRDKYNELPPEEQKRIDEGLESLNQELQQVMRQVRQEEKGGRDSLRELDQQVTTYAAQHLVDDMIEKWAGVPEVEEYLKAVLEDVVESADEFKRSDDESPATFMGITIPAKQRSEAAFRKYQVNVLVDNKGLSGAPIIRESNPNLQNLVGRVEHLAQFGALLTDFNMIKPGTLHAANGGFLILEAREVLLKPYAWDALKRTLKTGMVRIEDVGQQLGFTTTSTLDPEPVPLNAKVVLIGEPMIYYLLHSLDPDFQELFKVKADFDTIADRTAANEVLYARFIAHVCRREKLPPFSKEGVARIVEHGSRTVEDQRKLSVRFLGVVDLVREAAYWAMHRNGGSPDGTIVDRDDVQRAIDEHIHRSARIEERVREMIAQGTIMVDTEGEVAGQLNGLSVSMMGDYAFGRPSRITATTRLGNGDVVDIEREVEMGGPIHSKGVMILAGFLGARFAADRPLSLSARLVFEQSYAGVDGDSASSTELYAILSSLSGLPVAQRFAVTGSVNQRGQVQAIGGVNEKIEGFFAVCKEKGLTGDQGVLIPQANAANLMLRQEVRDAIAQGRFHVYPVSTVDEGIAILTGVAAGEPDAEGVYPEGTVNRLVADRLAELAKKAKEHRREGKIDEGGATDTVAPAPAARTARSTLRGVHRIPGRRALLKRRALGD
ncbi:MAG: AAA family ATPase [Thermoleophilia bacterium]|nr:AAA family ATPase [Thermoleophilia bacterium]